MRSPDSSTPLFRKENAQRFYRPRKTGIGIEVGFGSGNRKPETYILSLSAHPAEILRIPRPGTREKIRQTMSGFGRTIWELPGNLFQDAKYLIFGTGRYGETLGERISFVKDLYFRKF